MQFLIEFRFSKDLWKENCYLQERGSQGINHYPLKSTGILLMAFPVEF